MTRVLAIGLGPLLRPGVRHLGGQCLRTWHFTRPMLEAGHDVTLITSPVSPVSDQDKKRAGRAPWTDEEYEGFAYRSFVTTDLAKQIAAIDRLLRKEPFDAIVAINTYPAQLAASIQTRLPVWSDLNGWVMAEAQVFAQRSAADAEDADKCARPSGEYSTWEFEERPQHEKNIRWAHRQERIAVWRADRLSVVSEAQRHATIAELAMIGRWMVDFPTIDSVVVVPNAAAPPHVAVGRARAEIDDWPRPAGSSNEDDGAVWALWSGGFNTWTNIDALTAGLQEALDRVHELRVAVTGGAIEGYHNESFEKFRAWADGTTDRDRIKLLGWLPTEDMLDWYRRAAIGLNLDARSLEATFGARNRLTNMAASGLAVVSSRGTEVTRDLEAAGAGWFFEPDDADGLADALTMAATSESLPDRARAGYEFATTAYADAHTVAPLLEWLKEPKRAPDNYYDLWVTDDGFHEPKSYEPFNDTQRHEVVSPDEDMGALRVAQRDLDRLRRKLPIRIVRAIKSLLKGNGGAS